MTVRQISSSRRSILATVSLVAACSTPSNPPADTGNVIDVLADAVIPRDATDIVTTDAVSADVVADNGPDAASPDAGAIDPITAPAETWTWIPFADSRCGNGAATGIGVNLTTRSHHVIIYLEGGGACWDAATCFALRSAANVETGYTESNFRSEIASVGGAQLFNRTDTANPFRDASYVFVPYCTGDLHAGTRIATYDVLGTPRTVQHWGSLNMAMFLRRLTATFPAADRVWLSGSSAGGFGAFLNWSATQTAFGPARVDLLDDSGPPVTPPGGRFAVWRDAWNMALPSDCTACRDGFEPLLAYYRTRFGTGHRMALLSYLQDNVIATYYGISPTDFETRLNAVRATQITPDTAFNAYVLTGTDHTMLGGTATLHTAGGVALIDWIRQMATDAPGWSEAGP